MRGIKGGGGENAREGVKKDLKSFDASHAGSSPAPGTIQNQRVRKKLNHNSIRAISSGYYLDTLRRLTPFPGPRGGHEKPRTGRGSLGVVIRAFWGCLHGPGGQGVTRRPDLPTGPPAAPRAARQGQGLSHYTPPLHRPTGFLGPPTGSGSARVLGCLRRHAVVFLPLPQVPIAVQFLFSIATFSYLGVRSRGRLTGKLPG